MADQKELAFLDEVVEKTRDGKIPWEVTANEAEFIAALGGKFTLSVSEESGTDGWGRDSITYRLVLKDSSERVLTRLSGDDQNVAADAMYDLYQTARRRALKVDLKIDQVLGELKKL